MPVPLQNLDDRRWTDLVEQGRALVPLYAPEWTDHNASDPGITLMELFAWLTEMDVYRLNRVTDRHRRRLLQLLGIRPRPPRPSTVVAVLRHKDGPSLVPLPSSLELAGSKADCAPIAFRSTPAITLVPTGLRAVQRREGTAFHNATQAWTRGEPIALFGDDPRAGAEVYLGFDRPLPSDTWTQLFLVFDGPKTDLGERRRVLASERTGELPPHHSVRLGWEYLPDTAGPGQWQPLETADDTRSFTLSGSVRLRPDSAIQAQAVGLVAEPLYYVRCRLMEGAFEETPRAERVLLNAVAAVQSVPVWQTWSIDPSATVDGAASPGQIVGLHLALSQGMISSLSFGPAPAEGPTFLVLAYEPPIAGAAGSLTVEAELAGLGSGEPEQTLTLARRPAVEETLRLFTLEDNAWRQWHRVDDLAASSRTDAHYLVDPTTGEVTFGDGENGRTPPAGALVVAQYDATQAEAGIAGVTGVADTPLNRILLSDPSVIGRLEAGDQLVLEAGEAAETLGHAIGRAIESREASLRAITAQDCEAIAIETPGTRIARAIARPNLYPGLDCVKAPGVLTVVVLSSLPARRPGASAGLLAKVASRLERRRTIGSRVIVTGPRYLEVAVRARLRAFAGVDKARLGPEIAQRLDEFLHPLRGGPDRHGWPLGRDVYRAEVLQVIDETPGVDHVTSLEMIVEGCAPTCGNVCLRPTWLVAAGPHDIQVL